MLTSYLLPFAVCFVATVAALPVCARLLVRLGFLDQPDGQRKLHGRAIPRAGGVAVLLSSGVALGVVALLGGFDGEAFSTRFSVPGVAIAVGLMAVVGFADDRFQLRGRHKLVGQIVAALLAVQAGVQVDRVQLMGYELELGLWTVPVTTLWLVGAVNAFNLLDGMDGMAGCISTLVCLTIAGMAVVCGHPFVAAVALTLAGGLVGFLVYNLPPARVYLGDCGSLTVGFLVSILAVEGCVKGATTLSLVVPVALLALPIMDTGCALLRRLLTGRSIFAADRGHLHHCLLQKGWSVRGALALVCGLSVVLSAGAFLSVAVQNEAVAIIAAVSVTASLVCGRLFGAAELNLVRQRLTGVARRFVPNPSSHGWQMAVRIQGTSEYWDQLWQVVVAEVDRLRLDSVCLDVNAPRLHEAFHARRESAKGGGGSAGRWQVELPIRLHDHAIGRLRLSCRENGAPAGRTIDTFARLIERFEQRIEAETHAWPSADVVRPAVMAGRAQTRPLAVAAS